ncbi:MAG: multidrug effflux MFS transporter [Pseudomonadota bacterium]|nr:multidrug effflux MFS transporter [Pseudomonadota bacterium]
MNKASSALSTWLIITIALLTMIGPFSVDTYLPSFPELESEFRIDRSILLQSIGFYLIASAISTLFWGPLSDRAGRRVVIIGSLILYMFASIGCALSQDFNSFLLFRVLQGISASGGMVAGRAMIRDAHDERGAHRAMAYVMMLFALAPAIAPIIGGWLHQAFGWRSVFYFLALYGMTITFMAIYLLPETLAKDQRQSFHPLHVAKLYCRTMKNTRFLFFVLTLGTGFTGLFLYIAGSPTIIFDFLGLDSSYFAVQFVPMTAGIIAGSYLSAKLSHNLQAKNIVILALIIMLMASTLNVLLMLSDEFSSIKLILPLVIYSFGIALAIPGITVLSLDCFPHNRGTASAVQSFIQVIFSALAASLLVPLLSDSPLHYALAQLVCILFALFFWLAGNRLTLEPEDASVNSG